MNKPTLGSLKNIQPAGAFPISADPLKSFVCSWKANAAGAFVWTSPRINGVLVRAQAALTIPSAGDLAPTAPTNNYTIAVTDQYGGTVCTGTGSSSGSVDLTPFEILAGVAWPLAVDGPLTITIGAAGNLGEGTLVLYFRA